MDAVTGLVAELRDEQPPAERFDPRRHAVDRTGDAGVVYDMGHHRRVSEGVGPDAAEGTAE
jgi:hypothetical protein